jgi:hypothetical protein
MSFDIDNYEVIRNCISSELVDFVSVCFDIQEKVGLRYRPPTPLNPYPYGDSQTPNSFAWYGSLHGDAMLRYLKPKISDVVGKQLVETYSYFRIYYNGAMLEKHVDRPSCEYSASICLKKSSNWTFMLENFEKQTVEIELNPGDMIVYKGDVLPHWREKHTGDLHYQLFIHYVDVNGPFGKQNEYDGRPVLGLGPNEKIRDVK